jgi:hypothetical protein
MGRFGHVRTKFVAAQRKWSSPSPVRPTVLIQSDDWGRSGMPDKEVLEALKRAGIPVGNSGWDFYGLESGEDIYRLGDTLRRHVDIDGNPACMTANIVMANADLRRMVGEDFSSFRFVPISEGFPEPWENFDILSAYKRLMAMGVFYPALHGFTHFSPKHQVAGWHDKGEFGERVRCLVLNDCPYLASVTPEFNFALLQRHNGIDKFSNETDQREWIEMGVRLFKQSFDMMPVSTCAPGYRANATTYKLWAEQGIKVVQIASGCVAYEENGLFFIPRTVYFEPGLGKIDVKQVVEAALQQAKMAVDQGKMIVICSHSINYIQRHLGRREECLDALDQLLAGLLKMFPNLRFANDQQVCETWGRKDSSWFQYRVF